MQDDHAPTRLSSKGIFRSAIAWLGLGLVLLAPACGINEGDDGSLSTMSAVTFGQTTPGALVQPVGSDAKATSRFSLSETGDVSELRIYLSPSGQALTQAIRAVIYTDEAGAPGTLKAVSPEVVVSGTAAASWVSFRFASPVRLTAGNWWLGYHAGQTNGATRFHYDAVTGAMRWSSDAYGNGTSSTFGPSNISNQLLSISAVYSRTEKTFGTTSTPALLERLGSDAKPVSQFVLGEQGDVSTIRVYLAGNHMPTGQDVRAVIYTDVGGTPSALAGSTATVRVSGTAAAGWVTFRFATALRLSAGSYWLGVNSGYDNWSIRYGYDAIGTSYWTGDVFSDGASNPFGAPHAFTARVAAHATYLPTGASTPPSPPPPPPSTGYVPARGSLMIDNAAWTGVDRAQHSRDHDWAIFHAPAEAGTEADRDVWEAADSTSQSVVYQQFGGAVTNASWTTGMSATEARSRGFLARYQGAEATFWSGTLTSIDMGKAGWGDAIATLVISRMKALEPNAGGTGWEGVFFDDVNVIYPSMPAGISSGVHGVPDSYASVTAYKDAMKIQLAAARDKLHANGYRNVMGNVSAIADWKAESLPAVDIAGVLDWTVVEFCGIWPGLGVQSTPGVARIRDAAQLASQRGQGLVCNSPIASATDSARARFNDYFSRVIGEAGHIGASVAVDGRYSGPQFYDAAIFGVDYGAPVEPPQQSGSHFWRKFANGTTLHVDTSNLSAWRS